MGNNEVSEIPINGVSVPRVSLDPPFSRDLLWVTMRCLRYPSMASLFPGKFGSTSQQRPTMGNNEVWEIPINGVSVAR